MILVAVTLDLGRLAFARVTMENAAREGAMQAAKTPMSYSEDQPCPAGAGSNLVVCRTQLESQGSPITITPADIRMACAPDCEPGIGNTVTVNVTGTFRLLTPLLSVFFGGASNLLISSSASAQIETLPDPVVTPPWATPAPSASASASPSTSPSAGPCQIPSAGFTFTTAPNSGHAPVTVTVLDTSTSVGCSISTWEWTWGDGNSFFGQSPISHNFGSAGNYPVTLTVTNAAGRNTTGVVLIRVKP